MSLFKKKSDSEIPEIPSAPILPPLDVNVEHKRPTIDLPITSGDARDIVNRNVIKSAVEDSSEKIGGDGVGNNPSFESLPVAQPNLTQGQAPIQNIPVPPRQERRLPDPPRYDKQSFSQSLPIPPQGDDPIELSFVPKREIQKVELPTPDEKTVKKDANESIFVRIDKFHSAKHDIGEIERDIRQMNNIIEKITDVKMREDEEVLEINKMIEEIKERLSKIDIEIFNRV